MNARHSVAAFAGFFALAAVAEAAVVETQSNPVADGSINTSGGNNSRADWSGIPSYVADGNDGATSDWDRVSVAHDSTRFFVRYQMHATTFSGFLDFNQRIFIDADQNRSTGFTGGGDQFPIGAEYMVEGATLYPFTGGTSTSWSWGSGTGLSYDDFPTLDHELSIPRASLANPNSFDFVLFASGSPEDYYPSTGNAGPTGGFFTYAVPEPASLGALSLLGLTLTRRRR